MFFGRSENPMDKAIRLKREGKYDDSIKTYIEIASKNLDSNDLNEVLYALGKVYFLNKNFERSISAYLSCAFFLAFKKRPQMLNDMIDFVQNNNQYSPYIMWALDFGRHIGYAFFADKLERENRLFLDNTDDNRFLKIYSDSIASKNAPVEILINSGFDDKMAKIGANFITENLMDIITKKKDLNSYTSTVLAVALKMA